LEGGGVAQPTRTNAKPRQRRAEAQPLTPSGFWPFFVLPRPMSSRGRMSWADFTVKPGDNSGWIVQVNSESAAAHDLTVYVICVNAA
jgi:hypothetical protein